MWVIRFDLHELLAGLDGIAIAPHSVIMFAEEGVGFGLIGINAGDAAQDPRARRVQVNAPDLDQPEQNQKRHRQNRPARDDNPCRSWCGAAPESLGPIVPGQTRVPDSPGNGDVMCR